MSATCRTSGFRRAGRQPARRSPGRARCAAGVRGRRGTRTALRSAFGIDPASDVHRLSCGATTWNLVGNAELGGFAGSPERLLERPWALALVALLRPRTAISDTQFVVLSRPAGAEAALDVVRTDGTVAYLGTAESTAEHWRFHLADADRPHTVPTELAGVVDRAGLRLTDAAVSYASTDARETEPVALSPD